MPDQQFGSGMRCVRFVITVMMGALWAPAAAAQTSLDIERCRDISEDRMRLQCYDAIPLTPGRFRRSKYEVVDLAELAEYPLSYRGRLVEVSGWLTPSEDAFFLSTAADAENGLPIEADSLSRRDRDAVVAACLEGCQATVQGKVAPVNFTTGIIADTLRPE
jgi:hypothetical protein